MFGYIRGDVREIYSNYIILENGVMGRPNFRLFGEAQETVLSSEK